MIEQPDVDFGLFLYLVFQLIFLVVGLVRNRRDRDLPSSSALAILLGLTFAPVGMTATLQFFGAPWTPSLGGGIACYILLVIGEVKRVEHLHDTVRAALAKFNLPYNPKPGS